MDKLAKLIDKPKNFEDSLLFDSVDCFKHSETSFPINNVQKLDSIFFLGLNKDSSDYFFPKIYTQDLDSFSFDVPGINMLSNDKNEEPAKNKATKFFIITNFSKKGRKIRQTGSNLGRKRKNHSKSDFDNIITKIQVHFLNFFISFANDAVKCILANNN
jgi:hypothetical protein